jgi:hypothetical protein
MRFVDACGHPVEPGQDWMGLWWDRSCGNSISEEDCVCTICREQVDDPDWCENELAFEVK